MGELARDFYISSSERERSGRLAGGCVESGASKVWPGFLQERGQVLATTPNQPHSQLSRHSPGEVRRTDTGGADCAGQLRAGMTDGRGEGGTPAPGFCQREGSAHGHFSHHMF